MSLPKSHGRQENEHRGEVATRREVSFVRLALAPTDQNPHCPPQDHNAQHPSTVSTCRSVLVQFWVLKSSF